MISGQEEQQPLLIEYLLCARYRATGWGGIRAGDLRVMELTALGSN